MRGGQAVAALFLMLVLTGLAACAGQPGALTPTAIPSLPPPSRPSTAWTPTLTPPELPPIPTTLAEPSAQPPWLTPTRTAQLPRPLADFLRDATPVPPLAAADRPTLELLRLFYQPPGVVLQLDHEPVWTTFELKAATIPGGFQVDAVADNASHTRRAVTGLDEASDAWRLYLIDSSGQVQQVVWEAYADYRPVDSIRWLDDDVLVFAQWMNPHAGAAWAFDIATGKIAAAGFLSSPDAFPPIQAYESGEPLAHDPRTPTAPVLGDFVSIEPHPTPDDPAWAALVEKGQPIFRVQGYTFILDKEYWLPPYAVRLWRSDEWAERHVTISAQGRRTVQIDSVWYLTVHDRPGLLGAGAPSVEIVAGPPTGQGGFTTLLYSLAKTPRLMLETDFGPEGSFEDLDGDGVSEFVLTEPPCARVFCDNPAAVQSSTIYRYTGHGWTKANERFAARLAEERARNEQLAARATPGPPLEFTDKPRCAVYVHVADLLNLGRVADARQALEKYYKYPDAEEFWVEINQSVQGCVGVRPQSGQ